MCIPHEGSQEEGDRFFLVGSSNRTTPLGKENGSYELQRCLSISFIPFDSTCSLCYFKLQFLVIVREDIPCWINV